MKNVCVSWGQSFWWVLSSVRSWTEHKNTKDTLNWTHYQLHQNVHCNDLLLHALGSNRWRSVRSWTICEKCCLNLVTLCSSACLNLKEEKKKAVPSLKNHKFNFGGSEDEKLAWEKVCVVWGREICVNCMSLTVEVWDLAALLSGKKNSPTHEPPLNCNLMCLQFGYRNIMCLLVSFRGVGRLILLLFFFCCCFQSLC